MANVLTGISKQKIIRPLKVVVNTAIDQHRVSRDATARIVNGYKKHFNVLQLGMKNQFTCVAEKDTVIGGDLSLHAASNKRSFFETDDFILMGSAYEDIQNVLLTILLYKTISASSEVMEMFKSNPSLYKYLNENGSAIKQLNFHHGENICFHFFHEAMFRRTESDHLNKYLLSEGERKTIQSCNSRDYLEKDYVNKIRSEIKKYLPKHFGDLFRRSNLAVFEGFNANYFDNISQTHYGSFHVNLIYWSSIDKMFRYFSDKFDREIAPDQLKLDLQDPYPWF